MSRPAIRAPLVVAAVALPLVACGQGEPAARTEGLEETAPSPSEPAPELITGPAHAALPAWVPSTLHESLSSSRLPAMLPRPPTSGADPAIAPLSQALQSAEILHMDRWVSARLETTTYVAVIFGTDAHHEPPRGASFALPEADRAIRGVTGYAYENEGLYYAQWPEDGVAWEVEIDCLGASCDGVGLAIAVAESLEPVGGVR